MERKVFITLSNSLTAYADNLPSNEGRQSLIVSLHKAYKLYTQENVVAISPISIKELTNYHDSEFINHLLKDRDIDEKLKDDERFGLMHDCYPFTNMKEYITLVASSSLSIASTVIEYGNENIIGINWYGGRHHCQRAKCAGFCYINDIVLCINKLRRSSGTVFYLDLDLHHGDGIENAFKFSKKIITCSIHRYDVGFYPGTGKESSEGAYNIPTKKGLNDDNMMWIINKIVSPLIKKFNPKYLVIQVGCDGLHSDKYKEWNLTIEGYSNIIQKIAETFKIPIILLGGGGYNHTEVAKCWTYITGKLLNKDTNSWDIIPEHTKLDSYEEDGFRFWTDENSSPRGMRDENDIQYLKELKEYIFNL
ncbi:unnamed protein product [Candida verbasci]|uniref:Histone deacetylase domain-containing protein n=1 Tax=Candida verbasci TaxID=1227364 RepID=A0A9W4XB91_9ASCO|nr:unnamed protein product [Candida verbasci]